MKLRIKALIAIISVVMFLFWEGDFLMAGSIPYYKQYVSLDSTESKVFMDQALSSAINFLGQPDIPIQKLYLRLSIPIDLNSNLTRNFQLTELVDKNKGIFVIYLCHGPDKYSYYGQLAHEIAHLVNAQVYDAYVEGTNTLFAEQFLKSKGIDWKGWEQYFRSGEDTFYAETYFMMKDVAAIAGKAGMKTLLSYSEWTDSGRTKKHININAWLLSFPKETRQQIKDAINLHASKVKQAISDTKHPSAFVLPQ